MVDVGDKPATERIAVAEGRVVMTKSTLKLVLDGNGGGALQNVSVIWRQSPKVSGDGQFGGRIAFSPDGARVLTASRDRTARLWDAETGTEITRVALDAAVTALAVHGGCIALGDALGRVHVFDAQEFLSGKGGGGP